MDYNQYKNSRNMTWQLLIKHNINKLPVKISKICEAENIKIFSYSQAESIIKQLNLENFCNESDGFTMDGMIFYNQNCSVARQRFTVAHELGHIVLGHTQNNTLVNREISPYDNPLEMAANVYASRLLAPACVLRGIGVTNYKQIQELCNISETAAKFRMERMQQLYNREQEFLKKYGKSCFLLSPLERKVFEQFDKFIKLHKL